MDFMVSIRGRGTRTTILLRQDYLDRLAHQLAYKVGIHNQLAKCKEIPESRTSSTSIQFDSGISGIQGKNLHTRPTVHVVRAHYDPVRAAPRPCARRATELTTLLRFTTQTQHLYVNHIHVPLIE